MLRGITWSFYEAIAPNVTNDMVYYTQGLLTVLLFNALYGNF